MVEQEPLKLKVPRSTRGRLTMKIQSLKYNHGFAIGIDIFQLGHGTIFTFRLGIFFIQFQFNKKVR